MTDGSGDDFILNLKLACSYFPSTSDLCRKLAINRQQFMKYLSGGAFPSRANMRRICDFLGFDEYELLMPHERFRQIIKLRPVGSLGDLDLPPRFLSALADLRRDSAKLKILAGYYFQYYFSFSKEGFILRSLVHVYPLRGQLFYRRIERLRSDEIGGPPDIYKYDGVVAGVGDKIHMIDRETITGNELSHSILYPSHRNRTTLLTGLMIGVSGKEAHQPTASRVLLEYVGRAVDHRRALEGCRLYPTQSRDVPDVVRAFLLPETVDATPWMPPGVVRGG